MIFAPGKCRQRRFQCAIEFQIVTSSTSLRVGEKRLRRSSRRRIADSSLGSVLFLTSLAVNRLGNNLQTDGVELLQGRRQVSVINNENDRRWPKMFTILP